MVEKTDEGQQTEKKDSDADALSSLICAGLGGKDNIISLDCCATRLHVAMKDPMQMDDILLQELPVSIRKVAVCRLFTVPV